VWIGAREEFENATVVQNRNHLRVSDVVPATVAIVLPVYYIHML